MVEKKIIVKHPIAQEQDSPENEPPVKISKAILFRSLAVLWIFPSFGACWILASGLNRLLGAKGFLDAFSIIKIEELLAVLLLLAHAVFIFLAIRFRRLERTDN